MNRPYILTTIFFLLVGVSSPFGSLAASMLEANTVYQLGIRPVSSCFFNGQIGSCSEVSAFSQYSDNGLLLSDPVTGDSIGSSIDNDGWAGVIRFTTDSTGENLIVQSFNQDGFEMLPAVSPPNTIAFATDATQMTGTIDGAGNMIFTPVTRQAFMASFQSLGVQDFMFDDSSITAPTNDWIPMTTGTSTNDDLTGGTFSLTGVPFSPDGSGGFDGTLVSAGNYGSTWDIASRTPYVEIWDANIRTVVPIPAAVWLFLSGIMVLIGLARGKNRDYL